MPRALRLLTLLVLILALAMAGCLSSDDDDDDTITEPEGLPEATTSYQLMENFVTAYEGCDTDNYAALLHDDYVFYGKSGDTLSYWGELETFTRMCEGQQGDDGIAIADIEINSMTPWETWEEVPAADPYFGSYSDAYYCPYNVSIDFSIANQSMTYQVRGLAVFYVIQVGDVFQLLGITDSTDGGKATEAHSWTLVKLLFD